MEPDAGETIGERYTLTEHLGSGGFSTVWRARDTTHERDVALKLPSLERHSEQTVLEHFERERRLLEPFSTGLSHGSVVRYLDGSLDEEPCYIALEYLAGEPLSVAFGTGALGSGVRRRIATDLAETLDFLHRNGVLYLDLKPENIIVRRSGRPVLLDFNTAVARSETVDTVFEADQFKSPELLVDDRSERPVGPWSDVYSWGKLAFYLLCGAKVPTENVPAEGLDPRQFGSSCSKALANIVQRATRPERESRYEDGTKLASAVARESGRARLLVSHPSGVHCAVTDGAVCGRLAADEGVPRIVLADDDGHVAPQHARLSWSGEGWLLEDMSLNGTYVSGEDSWRFALSEDGYQTRLQQGALEPDQPQPPSTVPIPDGTIVAPVHPSYGIRLRVRALSEHNNGE